jgi:hypothetical protein
MCEQFLQELFSPIISQIAIKLIVSGQTSQRPRLIEIKRRHFHLRFATPIHRDFGIYQLDALSW